MIYELKIERPRENEDPQILCCFRLDIEALAEAIISKTEMHDKFYCSVLENGKQRNLNQQEARSLRKNIDQSFIPRIRKA